MKIIAISAKAQHGKDLSATILKELMESDGKKVLIAHYADLLKYICEKFFDWNGVKDEIGRTILQYVGTEVVREQVPDYWVDFIVSVLKMFPNEWDYIIIPDTRFPNEIDRLKEEGFDVATLKVNRIDFENSLTEEQRQHESEIALDNYEFDHVINVKSGIDILSETLRKVYKRGDVI